MRLLPDTLSRFTLSLSLVILLTALPSQALAQYSSAAEVTTAKGIPNLPRFDKRPVHFGFLLGFNVLDYHVYNTGLRTYENGGMARYAEVTELKPGLVLGIVTDFRLRDNLSFRVLPRSRSGSVTCSMSMSMAILLTRIRFSSSLLS